MRRLDCTLLGSIAIALFVHVAPAGAQCLTKPPKLDAAVNGKDAFAMAKAEGMKWNADSVPTKFTTLFPEGLDAQGRSINWAIDFFSPSAKKLNSMSIKKGVLECFVRDSASSARPIEITDKTPIDTKVLMDAAQQSGGSAIDLKTVTVTAALNQNPRRGALWYFTYQNPDTHAEKLQVIFDSTGKVRSATKK
jgi:hypothetical protein